jgi:hypothetical protein
MFSYFVSSFSKRKFVNTRLSPVISFDFFFLGFLKFRFIYFRAAKQFISLQLSLSVEWSKVVINYGRYDKPNRSGPTEFPGNIHAHRDVRPLRMISLTLFAI